MDSFYTATIANALTLAIVSILYVIKKRCESCSSSCNTGFFSCESEGVRNQKKEQKIDIVVKGLERHRENTSRADLGDI